MKSIFRRFSPMGVAAQAIGYVAAAAALVANASAADTVPVRRIPIEAFFDRAQISSPAISPDGSQVAFLSPVLGRTAVNVFDLATGKVRTVGRASDADINSFFWKGNDRIVFQGDPNGRESQAIIAVDLKANATVLAENWRENREDAAIAKIIDPMQYDPAHILVYGRSSRGGRTFGLFWINVLTGGRSMVPGDDFDTGGYRADAEGHIRFREHYAGNKATVQIRADARGPWRELTAYKAEMADVYSPVQVLAFSRTTPTVFLSREEPNGKDGIYAYNPLTGEWGDRVFETNEPISGVRFSWNRDRLESVRYGPDGRQEKWFDGRLEAIWQRLRAAFPRDFDVRITSSDEKEQVFAVAVYSDVFAGAFYLLDLRGRTQLVELGKILPGLPPHEMRPMRPISYRARDGLLIHGYLTLPAGASGKRVPMILNPHGGPYGVRDSWHFVPEVQFLANRGYAVLQVNYRGSGGYGTDFLLAGKHEWGRKMQDDLTDAVHWAIDQGIADPKRVCIYGASYGGYAALAGAVFTPELYCCAVNYVGVADLSLISDWQHENSRSGEAYFRDMVGDDAKFLHDYSPVNFVENIRVPTLHAYGENDPRVVIRHWHELESQLRRYHKKYDLVYQGNEGHGFRNVSARLEFYGKLESFLAENCPP